MTPVSLDHPLVAEYLRRLDAAAAGLPMDRRDELRAEIGGHVRDALAACGDDEASVRGVLDRIGDPYEIVAAEGGALSTGGQAGDRPAPGTPAPPRPGPWGPLELGAVLGLTVGSVVLPVVGTIIGITCAWLSPRWSRRQKSIASVLAALPLLVVLVAGLSLFAARVSYSEESGRPLPVESVQPAVPLPAPTSAGGVG